MLIHHHRRPIPPPQHFPTQYGEPTSSQSILLYSSVIHPSFSDGRKETRKNIIMLNTMTLILTFLVYCYDKGGARRIRKKARGRLCWWQERFLFHGRESSSESSKELVEDNASTNSPTTIQSLHSPTLPPLSLPLSLARKGRGARMVIISH